jgi:hypothetical protein
VRPARITYYVDPKARPGLRPFDGVNWIRGVRLADPRAPARIDLTDLARAAALPERATRFSCAFTNAATTDHVVYHGLSYATPDALRARMPDRVEDGWTADGDCTFTVKALERPAPANAITGTLENVARITLRLGRRHVDVSGITSKTPVRVRLR